MESPQTANLKHPHEQESESSSKGSSSIHFRLLGYGILMGWHFLILYSPIPISDEMQLPTTFLLRQVALNASLCFFFFFIGWLLDKYIFITEKRKLLFLVSSTLVATLSGLGVVLSMIEGIQVFLLISVSFMGAGEAALILLWLRFYSETSVNYSGIYLAASAVIGSLICYFTRHLTTDISLMVFVLLPFISGIMYYYGSQRTERRSEKNGERGIPDWEGARKPLIRSTIQISVCAFFFGFFQGCVTPDGHSLFSISESTSVLGVGVAGLLVVVLFYATSFRPQLDLVHKASALLLIGGLMLVPFVSDTLAIIAATATMTGFILLDLLTLMLIVNISRTLDLSPGKVIGINRSFEYGAFAVGILLGFILWGNYNEYLGFSFLIASIAAFTCIAVTLFCARDERSIWAADAKLFYVGKEFELESAPLTIEESSESSSIGRWRSACNTVCENYGLSPRECEIFFLLAKGRNAEFVQNALYISTHTAKTHISNIYRKLEIHSAQDLINLVEEAKE